MNEEQMREVLRLANLLVVARIRAFAHRNGIAGPGETFDGTTARQVRAQAEFYKYLEGLVC